ncbi:GntR family transcriptional regulator [Phaeobacter marinintestinus]|uniref:GntR family transcriptional regulator n=1 Tax=Falsiphaeobacter marinintestinus TaxID=1492905 RepID=UPI0011B74CB1|nr:GntR family transcriptional regulator [Phaeobacter marinintestinus]
MDHITKQAAEPLPVTPSSATHKAYAALRRMILIGEFSPGEKLKIDTLRKVLDTGASPVREALSLLTSDQLVERIDQRGFRAAATSKANFEEILGLRCHLEDMALRKSVANGDDAWEERLVLAHHRMVREGRDNDEAFEERHKAFHMALLDNCDSPVLMKFCNQLYDLNIRYRYLAGRALGYQKRDIAREHADILAAAIERDADLAARRLIDHYRQTGAFLTDLLDDNGQPRD